MVFGLSQVRMNVVSATRTLPMGEFWITGGAGLPAARDGLRAVVKSLTERGLLVKGGFTDEHKGALLCVRTLLKHDASEHIKYHNFSEVEDESDIFREKADATPGRNSPCPCGSGKRFKRCCGERG